MIKSQHVSARDTLFKSDVSMLNLACQKAQGGDWDKVYVNLFGVNDKKWIYTAMTRARRELHVFGQGK